MENVEDAQNFNTEHGSWSMERGDGARIVLMLQRWRQLGHRCPSLRAGHYGRRMPSAAVLLARFILAKAQGRSRGCGQL